MSGMVAAPIDPGACLVAESGGVAQQRLRVSLPEAGIVAPSAGVHLPCGGVLAGVRPALRPPLRVDVDQSEDAAMVCRPSLAIRLRWQGPERWPRRRLG